LLQLGRLHEAHAYAITTLDLAERHELQPYIRAGLCARVATARVAIGEGPRALEHAERCRAFLAHERIGGAPKVSALATCARAAADAGDLAAFERYLAEANEEANAGGPELRAMVARARRSVEVRGHASVPPEGGLGAEVTTTARGQRSRESRRVRSED
jgi:hypothetical protein